jgi:hypothetical protein
MLMVSLMSFPPLLLTIPISGGILCRKKPGRSDGLSGQTSPSNKKKIPASASNETVKNPSRSVKGNVRIMLGGDGFYQALGGMPGNLNPLRG